MKTKKIALIICAAIMSFANAQEKVVNKTTSESMEKLLIDVGGKAIDFSFPDTNFVEASNNLSPIFYHLMPETHLMVCAFLPKNDAQKFIESEKPAMETYILVSIIKEVERLDCKPEDFKRFISSMGENPPITNKMIEEINDGLKTPNAEVNNLKMLGTILSKEDAIACGMIAKCQVDDEIEIMIASYLAIRLKERLINVYIYKKYDGQTSVDEIIAMTDSYASHLFKINSDDYQDNTTSISWVRIALIVAGLGLLYLLISFILKRKTKSITLKQTKS